MDWMGELTKLKIRQLKKQYPGEWQRNQRREYLLKKYHKTFKKHYLKSRKYIEDVIREIWRVMGIKDSTTDPLTHAHCTESISELVHVLVKFQNKHYYKREVRPENGISQNDIANAREYPFEQLIEFSHGRALCPFHKDTEPSMQYYRHNNHVRCFSCNKSWDPIGFMMDKYNLNFVEAVRRLS